MQNDPAIHKQLAIDLFNLVWQYLDKPSRTLEENDTMLHAAHASRFHWEQVGTPLNLARGEWQVSRVYSVLQRPEPALYHARRSLEICQQNSIADFDLAFAYEALARAHSISGNSADTKAYLALAHQAGNNIAIKEDKDLFFSDLGTIPTLD